MKAKLIVSCLVSLILLVAGCATIGQFEQAKHRDITLCGANPTDCLTFTIPAEYPDFIHDFGEENIICMADMMLATCVWWDGEEIEDGSIPTARWYTMMFWNTSKIAETTPVILEFDHKIDHKTVDSAYYVYNEKGVPEKVSEYECHKFLYNLYGYPVPSEEEYYEQQRKAQEEWERLLKEYEEKQQMEELGQQKT